MSFTLENREESVGVSAALCDDGVAGAPMHSAPEVGHLDTGGGDLNDGGDLDEGEVAAPTEVEESEAASPIEIEDVHDDDRHPCDLPYPAEYAFGDGNELVYSYTTAQGAVAGAEPSRSKRVVYHSQVVYPEDTTALCMAIECDRSEKECTLAVCPDNTRVVGSFAEFFPGGTTLKPIRGSMVRVCVCPMHAKVVMSSYLMDAIKCAVALPRLAVATPFDRPNDSSDTAKRDSRGWRVVAENGDGFVRFFDVERTTSCYCNFPVLFST